MGKLSLILSFLSLVVALAQPSTAQLYKVAAFGKSCSPGSLIMPTVCNLYGRTVKCSSEFLGKCECNLGDDALFEYVDEEEEEQACVGKVRGLCFTDANLLGRKMCTKFADCFVEADQVEGQTIGKCQCLQGYQETVNRTCERDPNVEITGTMRTTTRRIPTAPSTTTMDPDATTTTGPPPTDGQSLTLVANGLIIITLFLNLVGYKMF